MNIKNSTIDWLLQEDNPPIRYLTLTNILGNPTDSNDVVTTRSKLMDYVPIQNILSHVDEFIGETNEYRRYWKYTGIYWQLIFLGQFLANGQNQQISRILEAVTNERKWINHRGGQCLTAGILRALIKLGYKEHPTVKNEIENLAKRIVEKEGIECEVMNLSLLTKCHMAIPKLLLCFAEIPTEERSDIVNSAVIILIKKLVENEVYIYTSSWSKEWKVILESAPHRGDLPQGQTVKSWILEKKAEFLHTKGFGTRKEKKGWLKFGFPLHYNSDILEGMYALALLEEPYNSSLEKPLEVIRAKETAEGKWILENSLNGKMWTDVEEKGQPSKWITYFSLYVLNHFKKEMKV